MKVIKLSGYSDYYPEFFTRNFFEDVNSDPALYHVIDYITINKIVVRNAEYLRLKFSTHIFQITCIQIIMHK